MYKKNSQVIGGHRPTIHMNDQTLSPQSAAYKIIMGLHDKRHLNAVVTTIMGFRECAVAKDWQCTEALCILWEWNSGFHAVQAVAFTVKAS